MSGHPPESLESNLRCVIHSHFNPVSAGRTQPKQSCQQPSSTAVPGKQAGVWETSVSHCRTELERQLTTLSFPLVPSFCPQLSQLCVMQVLVEYILILDIFHLLFSGFKLLCTLPPPSPQRITVFPFLTSLEWFKFFSILPSWFCYEGNVCVLNLNEDSNFQIFSPLLNKSLTDYV